MRYKRRKPCGNCPFRKEAPLAHWHPEEYLMLQRLKRTEEEFDRSGIFGCHKDNNLPKEEQEMCVGWLLHQRENNVNSLALRIKLMDPEALKQFEECEPDGEQFETIEELVRLNIEEDMVLNPERYEDS